MDAFKSSAKPGKNIIFNESMIPWRGLLNFRQYMLGKKHKYDMKLYKLYLPED